MGLQLIFKSYRAQRMRSGPVTFWLNVAMIIQWSCLCYVFCQKQLSTSTRSPLLEFLIQV